MSRRHRNRERGRPRPSRTAAPRKAAVLPAVPSPIPSIGERVWFAPALTAAYALLLAFTLFHHELWRDELQAWMLARDSSGPLDLFRNAEYEGSPITSPNGDRASESPREQPREQTSSVKPRGKRRRTGCSGSSVRLASLPVRPGY